MSDERASHKYCIEIPDRVDDLGLSPHAYRLYVRVKRLIGDTGVCHDSARELAEHCRMSVGQVARAKRELKRHGIVSTGRVNNRDDIRIAEEWL